MHAKSALKGANCPHCEWLPLGTLCSWRALFEEGAFNSIPHRASEATPSLRFLPNLHTEVSKSWTRPFSARHFIPFPIIMEKNDAPSVTDVCKLSVSRDGIVSEGSGTAHHAAHYISTGGQRVCGSRSGWCVSAHNGCVTGVPSRPAGGVSPRRLKLINLLT